MATWTARPIPRTLVLLILGILSTQTFALDVADDAEHSMENVVRRSPALGIPLQRRNTRRYLKEDEYGAWAQQQVENLRVKYGGQPSEGKRAVGTAGLANRASLLSSNTLDVQLIFASLAL